MPAAAPPPPPDDWHATFFDADYLRVFEPFITPERTEREVNELLDLLALGPGVRVLDAPCGQGRHAVPLAALDCLVTGVDRSPYLLDRAREAAAAQGVGVAFHERDLRDPLPAAIVDGGFDVVLNLYNSFGYFADEADDARLLRTLAEALAPDGRLVMEVANRESDIRDPRTTEVARPEPGLLVAVERDLDLRTSRVTTTYTLVEDGRPPRTTGHVQRLYTLTELLRHFDEAGLDVLDVHGDLDGRPLDLDDDAVVLVATRRVR